MDIDALREIAQAATPGPRTIQDQGHWWINTDEPVVPTIAMVPRRRLADAELMAACGPETIIALCDEVLHLREVIGDV